jgi:hypothetical protein
MTEGIKLKSVVAVTISVLFYDALSIRDYITSPDGRIGQ